MQLNKPILDARSFQQIRDELVARIPVYTPEWTDHNASDPGITFLELYSYLAENLLYRFNQIPEATFLEFLRLLQIPLLPAEPASSLVTFSTEKMSGVRVPKGTLAKAGEIGFSTLNEVRVLPVSAFAVAKTTAEFPEQGSDEEQFFEQAMRTQSLATASEAAAYSPSLLWQQNPGSVVDFNETVDGILWVPVLAEKPDQVAALRAALADHNEAPLLLNLGVVPDARIDAISDVHSQEFADRFRCPGSTGGDQNAAVEWQIWSQLNADNWQPTYRSLTVVGDTSSGLSQEGVVRLRLPRDLAEISAFDIDDPDAVGTGNLPPPLDDELALRTVFWLRAFRHDGSRFGKLVYLGANCAQVEQTVPAKGEFLGTGDAQPNQQYNLVNAQVVAQSLTLEVEEPDGWRAWTEVDNFFASDQQDRHFTVDAAAGRVQFGTGLQGLVPQIGQRIRVTGYRYGGGIAGNVAAEAIEKLPANLSVKLMNPLAAYGGADAESIEQALERIPAELRRRDRAVTEDDFQELAKLTPGAAISRAQCLPRYHPQFPGQETAGVVSVVVFPSQDAVTPNAPMPDKNQLRGVCRYLDARRLVTTELYVLPPKYRQVAIAVGLKVKPGYGVDAVRHWVELVIRQYLAPLPPYGPSGAGWPMGRRIHAPELEAAAHQVEGVEYIEDMQLVGWDDDGAIIRLVDGSISRSTIELTPIEVPELIGITIESGPITLDPAQLNPLNPGDPDKLPVPVPVLSEVC